MTTRGRGLAHWGTSRLERRHREERRVLIGECRRSARIELDVSGREWTVVRLPDAYGADYPDHYDHSEPKEDA